MAGAGAHEADDHWRVSHDGPVSSAAAIPMPLMHTVELNAGTVDTDSGPRLRAGWTWALSALDHSQVNRLSQLWFDALTGICTHVRGGGGGLTPSDIAPARLEQHQIDELCRTHRVADILPLTPLQQGLLFHAGVAHESGDDVYAVQLDVTLRGPLDLGRLHEALRAVLARHPHLVARFTARFEQPVQVISDEPEIYCHYEDLTGTDIDIDARIASVCATERATVCDLTGQAPLRAALIRTDTDEHRFIVTNHHIVLDGWSLPILLGEVFAAYYGHRLPAAVPYRRFINWLADRDLDTARTAWSEVLSGFDTPTLIGPPNQLTPASRHVAALRVSRETTRAISELARTHRTTVSTVLQAAWAQVLMWVTGQRDVVFGAVVSGRPTDLPGAEAMVGLLINTVPVRANVSAATTTADLLSQLQQVRNQTLEHEHLGLSEIHRLTGHRRLFDTVVVYENYPTDTAQLAGADGLALTSLDNRDFYHYPLAIQAVPGDELDLRVQYRGDVFDETAVRALVDRYHEVLVAMATSPNQPLPAVRPSDNGELARLARWSDQAVSPPDLDRDGSDDRGPVTPAEQVLIDIYAQVLGRQHVGVDESFFYLGGDSLSAMRAVAAINAAFDVHLALPTLFDKPTVRSLNNHLTYSAGYQMGARK
ncbi:condensation domain-containing protein, partial [Mycolicibacterium elephantis]